jgi:Family of unknown function (DUF6252)
MKNTILAVIVLLSFSACNKEVKELPGPTQAGANTFGLKLNGVMWVPKGFAGIPDNDMLTARKLGDNLIITAQNFASSPTETEFVIKLFGVTGTGTYLLNTNTNHPGGMSNYAYHVKRNLNPIDDWITSATQTGSVTLTRYDTTARIVSGTFQFNAENVMNPAQTISVTEGRFDIKY